MAAANQYYSTIPTAPTQYSVFNTGGGSMAESTPGVVSPSSWSNPNPLPSDYNVPMNYAKGPGGIGFENPMFPGLTGSWAQFLNSYVGKGATPFNLSVPYATGGTSQPGQLDAPLNPTLQQLLDYFNTGKSSNAGITALNTLSQGISAVPEWQTALKAMQQNIQENQANLKEQFGSTGALGGSEYGNAMKDYMAQTTADQNALLAQLQQQNQQTRLSAGTQLSNLQSQMGQIFQGLNQQDIQNVLQEFIRTSPEYSPLLNMIYGQSNAFAPIFNYSTGAGILGGMIPGIGKAAGAAGQSLLGGSSMSTALMAALGAL